MSPQCFSNKLGEDASDFSNDVWALGRTFLELMLCDIRPELNSI